MIAALLSQPGLRIFRRMKDRVRYLILHLRFIIGRLRKNQMPTLSTIGIAAPQDFAIGPYEATDRRISSQKDSHPTEWAQCAGAWNAIAYRFISCAEHDAVFTESVRQH